MTSTQYTTPTKPQPSTSCYVPPTPPTTPPRHRRPLAHSPAPPPPPAAPPIPSHNSRPPRRTTQPASKPANQHCLEDVTASALAARLQTQSQESLTISKFASLVARLNDGRNRNPTVRAALITDFAASYNLGKFTSSGKPFNRPKHATRAARDKLATYPTGRGVLAEITIKEGLDGEGVLVAHADGEEMGRIVQGAMGKAREEGRAVYIDCGLVASPEFAVEYEGWGWARPGVRWNGFIPDLIKVEVGSGGRCTFEVIEIKYSAREELTVWPNYKVQAVFYHLALTKLLRHIPDLSPSHQVTIWRSRDFLSPIPIPSTLALRTNLAFVEELLFSVLPTWLGAVRVTELGGQAGVVRVELPRPVYVDQNTPTIRLPLPASLKPGGPTAPYTAYVVPLPSPPTTPVRTIRGPRASATTPTPAAHQSRTRPQPPAAVASQPPKVTQVQPARPVAPAAATPRKEKKKGPIRRALRKIGKAFGKMFD